MNDVWNLNPLYRGFEDPAFEADLNELKKKVAQFEAFTGNLQNVDPARGLKEGIVLQEDINFLAAKLVEYASLRQAADTRNPEAGSQVGRCMAVLSAMAAPGAAFESWAAKLPDLMELVRADELLKE